MKLILIPVCRETMIMWHVLITISHDYVTWSISHVTCPFSHVTWSYDMFSIRNGHHRISTLPPPPPPPLDLVDEWMNLYISTTQNFLIVYFVSHVAGMPHMCLTCHMWYVSIPLWPLHYIQGCKGLWLLASQSFKSPGLMRSGGQSSPSPTYFSTNWIAMWFELKMGFELTTSGSVV